MRIPPFCYIADYFRKRSEEKKKKLKEEILTELTAKTKSALDEQGKSVREDGRRLIKEFSKEIKDDKKSLESQMKTLLEEFSGVKYQSETVSGVASAVKKDSERIKAYADEAKSKADGAEKGVQAMEAAAKRANELCDKINVILDKYTAKAVDAAVEKCTATVKSEMDKAVQEARKEYHINIEDHKDMLERDNNKKMEVHSKKFGDLAQAAIDAFKKECQAAIDNLMNQYKSELDSFKKDYAELRSDYQKLTPRLDVAAQKFKKLEEQIIKLEEAIHGRPWYLVTASLLSSIQREQLRELYSDKFKGDASRYKRYLEEWRDSKLKGKKNLTPAELEVDFVPVAFTQMMKVIERFTRDEVYELLDAIDVVDGIKKTVNNNSKPGSGRYNKH